MFQSLTKLVESLFTIERTGGQTKVTKPLQIVYAVLFRCAKQFSVFLLNFAHFQDYVFMQHVHVDVC